MAYTLSQSIQGAGAQLSIGPAVGGEGSNFTPVFEITNAPLPEPEFDKLDVTNLNSNAHEFHKGLPNYGEMSLSGNSVSTDPGQIAMSAAFADKQNAYQFKMAIPLRPGQTTTGDTYAFNGLVMSWGPVGELDATKTVTFKAKIQITGAWTFTAGS